MNQHFSINFIQFGGMINKSKDFIKFEHIHKGRHPKKKTADLVKIALLGGRGSEKLLNFHHLQMMKNMEGGGLRVTFHYFIEPNYD